MLKIYLIQIDSLFHALFMRLLVRAGWKKVFASACRGAHALSLLTFMKFHISPPSILHELISRRSRSAACLLFHFRAFGVSIMHSAGPFCARCTLDSRTRYIVSPGGVAVPSVSGPPRLITKTWPKIADRGSHKQRNSQISFCDLTFVFKLYCWVTSGKFEFGSNGNYLYLR